jgi:hypothetical protein
MLVSAPGPQLALQMVREQLPQVALVQRLAPGPKVDAGLRLAQAPEVEARAQGMAGLSHNRI